MQNVWKTILIPMLKQVRIIIKQVESCKMAQVIQTSKLLEYIQTVPITKQFEQFLVSEHIPRRLMIPGLTPQGLRELCDKINYQSVLECQRVDRWKLGEFKLFAWVSIYLAFNNGIPVQELTHKHYEFLESIFLGKTEQKMRYELLCFYPLQQYCKRKWEEQQIDLLKRLIKRQEELGQKRPKWKSISLDLYLESQGRCFKTFSQCREKWLNHLSPTVKKKKWTKEEDYMLLTLYRQLDRSWARVAKKFDGMRTAHMIKNRYHSLLKRARKCYSRLKSEQIETKLIESLAVKIQKEKSRKELNPTANQTHMEQVKPERSPSLKKDLNEEKHQQGLEVVDFVGKESEQDDWKEGSEQDHWKESLGLGEVEGYMARQPSKQVPTETFQFGADDFLLERSLFDLNPIERSKWLSQDGLLSKLGCEHFQQLDQAFQLCCSWNRPCYY